VAASGHGGLIRSAQYVEAIEVGRRALAMAEALGLESQQSRVLSMIGIARVNRGDTGGIADLERSVAVAQQANLPEAGAPAGTLPARWPTWATWPGRSSSRPRVAGWPSGSGR
jgi:hypothetical protein